MLQVSQFKLKVQGSSSQKTLFGLHQSPHAIWKYLTENLCNYDLLQAPFDSCLFIGEKRFLGVHIGCDTKYGFVKMIQKGLIKQSLQTLGLNVGTANRKFTPAKGKPFAKNLH